MCGGGRGRGGRRSDLKKKISGWEGGGGVGL